MYSEDLNFAANKDMGPKDFFEMGCNQLSMGEASTAHLLFSCRDRFYLPCVSN